MERKLVNRNGTVITFEYVEKSSKYPMTSIYRDGERHLTFIKDMEKEIELLKAEGYVDVKE